MNLNFVCLFSFISCRIATCNFKADRSSFTRVCPTAKSIITLKEVRCAPDATNRLPVRNSFCCCCCFYVVVYFSSIRFQPFNLILFAIVLIIRSVHHCHVQKISPGTFRLLLLSETIEERHVQRAGRQTLLSRLL